MRLSRVPFLLAATLALASCGGGGPATGTVIGASGAQTYNRTVEAEPFVLVDVGLRFAERISADTTERHWSMPSGGPSAYAIGVSDVLDISIVTNNDAGFIDFTQSAVTPIATTPLPRQVVAEDGSVAVPLLGRVHAAGRSVQSLENFLTRRLSGVLVNPTAIVQLVDRQSATVSVIGEGIRSPGTYPINLSDRRLLDIVGRAGGPTAEAGDIIVSLSRGGRTYEAALQDIYGHEGLNPFVRKGDVISIEPRMTRVQVVGATGTNTQVELAQVDVSLMDVLSAAGGLNSPRADLKGVFVYRQSTPHQLRGLGADLGAFRGRDTVPTVYRFDMTEPTAFFTAEAFGMRDDDILYVAESLNAKLSNVFGASGYFAPNPSAYVQDATLGN